MYYRLIRRFVDTLETPTGGLPGRLPLFLGGP